MMLALGLGLSGGRPPGAIAGWLAAQERVADWRPELGLVWQADDQSQPVTAAGQSAGRIHAAPSGPSVMALTQAAALSRPTYQSDGFVFDGGDFWEGAGVVADLSRAAACMSCAMRVWFSSLATQQRIFNISTGAAGQQGRFTCFVDADGNVRVNARRADADGITARFSSGGPITAGAWFSLLWTADFLAGGEGALRCYVNGGSDVINGAMGGSGLTADTSALRVRVGSGLSPTPSDFLTGKLRRLIVAQGAAPPTAAERAAIFAELEAT